MLQNALTYRAKKHECSKQDNRYIILLKFLYEIASSLMLLAKTLLVHHCFVLSLRAKRGNLVFVKDWRSINCTRQGGIDGFQ